MVLNRCLLSMLLCFPFLGFCIFHNKLSLMKNLDISILCVLQHSIFVTLCSLFLFFSWEVHLSKIWPNSVLLTPFTGATFVQLKRFWLLLFIYGLHLLRILWKKNRAGKHVKRLLLDGVDNFRLVQRQMKVPKPNYKLRWSQKIN